MKYLFNRLEKPAKTSDTEPADLLAGLATDFYGAVQTLLGPEATTQYAARQHEIAAKVSRILPENF